MATTTEIPSILTPIQPQTVQVTDTTLFHLAAQYLGDAEMWNYLIEMNPDQVNEDGFWEYQINGAAIIALPINGQFVTNGGILNAFPAPETAVGRSFSNGFNFGFE